MECLRKDIQSAYLERSTYSIIASKGIKIRVSHRERLRMLLSMWKTSGQRSIGRSAWFVLATRQALRMIVLFLTDVSRLRPKPHTSSNS